MAVQSGVGIGRITNDPSPRLLANSNAVAHNFTLLFENLDHHQKGGAAIVILVATVSLHQIGQVFSHALTQLIDAVVVELLPAEK